MGTMPVTAVNEYTYFIVTTVLLLFTAESPAFLTTLSSTEYKLLEIILELKNMIP